MPAFTRTIMEVPMEKMELEEFYGYMNGLIADFEPIDFPTIFSSDKSEWFKVAYEIKDNRKLEHLKQKKLLEQDELEVEELNKAVDKDICLIQDVIFDSSIYHQSAKESGI